MDSSSAYVVFFNLNRFRCREREERGSVLFLIPLFIQNSTLPLWFTVSMKTNDIVWLHPNPMKTGGAVWIMDGPGMIVPPIWPR